MRCIKADCEVDMLLEHNAIIILNGNKIIVCVCGEKRNPFKKKLLKAADVQPDEVEEAPITPQVQPESSEQPWQFPPPLPKPYVYTNDQDNPIKPLGNERSSFRRFRKSIRGSWKKLVGKKGKKPEQDAHDSIPPELKPKLKQMYVY